MVDTIAAADADVVTLQEVSRGWVLGVIDLGSDVTETDDGLEIRPAELHAGTFHTYADHRMAHAAVVLGAAVDGVRVENVGTTSKTFPGFAEAWSRMFARA